MHRTAMTAGTVTILIVAVLVLTLGVGFGVNLTQALYQAAPIILATGVAVGLGTLVLNRELA